MHSARCRSALGDVQPRARPGPGEAGDGGRARPDRVLLRRWNRLGGRAPAAGRAGGAAGVARTARLHERLRLDEVHAGGGRRAGGGHGLRVERVDEGRAFAEAFVRGYGTPDVFGDWVARLPGGRAGTASPRSTAPTQRVSGRSTSPAQSAGSESPRRPEHRRKGAQNAILAARIDAAAAVGCEVVATETGEPGGGEPGGSWRNIARAGFEPQYVRPNYLSGREDA